MADRPTSDPAARTDNSNVRHETSDVDIRAILGCGLGLVVTAIAIHFLVWLLFVYFTGRETQSAAREFPLAVEQQNRLPPEPRLQTNPRQDLGALRAREDRQLNTYGWVDQGKEIVRIPIEEAMRLSVERGLPTRPDNVAKR